MMPNPAGRTRLPMSKLAFKHDLTVVELQIARYIALGLDNADIAASLGLAEKSVHAYIGRIRDHVEDVTGMRPTVRGLVRWCVLEQLKNLTASELWNALGKVEDVY